MALGYVHAWYGYGYGSGWIILAFVAMAVVRGIMIRNRRGLPPGRRGSRTRWGPTPGGMQSAVHHPAAPTTRPVPDIAGGVPPGWLPDPSGRFDQRYWSGTAWTEHVVKDGVPSTDPPPGRGPSSEAVADGSSHTQGPRPGVPGSEDGPRPADPGESDR